MLKQIFKTTAITATFLVLVSLVFNACSKQEINEHIKPEVSQEYRQANSTHYTIKNCDLAGGGNGVMCGIGSSDDCWRPIDCKESEGVLEKYYTREELEDLIKNNRPLKAEVIKELKDKKILPIK